MNKLLSTLSILLTALALLGATACGIPSAAGDADAPTESAAPTFTSAPSPAVSELPDPKDVIAHSIVLTAGSDTVWINGTAFCMEGKAVLADGVLYVPAEGLALLLGASFVSAEDVYYFNINGNVSVFMEDYNVILVNNKAHVMRSTPTQLNGVLCLPIEGIAAAVSASVSRDPVNGIYVIEHFDSRLSRQMLLAVAGAVGVSAEYRENGAIKALAERYGSDHDTVETLASNGLLWLTDENGTPSSVTLGDDGSLVFTEYVISAPLPPDSALYTKTGANGVSLCELSTRRKVADETPDAMFVSELKAATARFMELKAAADINGDEKAESLLGVYFDAICVSFDSEEYRLDLAEPYETGLYSGSAAGDYYDGVFANARVGDFLLFSSDEAGPEYGCFNHCALIIGKDDQAGTLRLLHARGAEYGVGADLEMDMLTEASFTEEKYYSGYSTVFLCRAGSLTEDEAARLAENAYSRFNGAAFGYGGRMGLDEVNCTELIDESYIDAGVDIIDGDYASRLKEVLKGNTRNLVLIPDDLMFSNNTMVIAIWIR